MTALSIFMKLVGKHGSGASYMEELSHLLRADSPLVSHKAQSSDSVGNILLCFLILMLC